jgi:vitamin B12 transporter
MRRIAGPGLLLSVPFAVAAAAAAAAADETPLLDEVSIIATRAPDGIPVGLVGASLTVIDPRDMQDRQTRVVSDVLRDVPGLAVNRAGAVGSPTQVRIRGAEGNHTLVLVDGVKASDPYYDEFDFATLIADDVARVEVLRGQQSSLYGSDAIGGVISYSTLDGREAPGLSGRLEYGTYQSLDTAVRYGGVAGVMDYAISAGLQKTDGYRVARVGNREISAENRVASGKFGFDLGEALRIKATLRVNRTEADSTDEDYNLLTPEFGAIDGAGSFVNKTFIGALRAEHAAFGDQWLNAVSVQRVQAHREGENGFGPAGDKGERTRYSVESTLRFGEREAIQQLLTLAVDRETTQARNTQAFSSAQGEQHGTDNTGIVAQYTLLANQRLGAGVSFRHDDNSRFENATTYRVQGSYRFDGGTRLRAASGSGIKNPSLTELFGYDPAFYVGNPDLKPEKSRGWEAGIDQELLDGQVLLGATYFHARLENEIYTAFGPPPDFLSTPANRDTKSTQRGMELSADARLMRGVRVAAAWTHLRAREDGVREIRRPSNVASLNLGWRSDAEVFGANLTVRYNGRMTDSNFYGVGPSPAPLQEFTLLNLAVDWRFSDGVQFFGRVENLLDEHYEENYTYRAMGRTGFAGVRLKF